jgi:cell division protein ZapE
VGGGKSFIMAMFYQHCAINNKRRVHFNIFMLEVHQFIHQWHQNANNGDALKSFAKQIRQQFLLLCFDEFHVSDIADAMLLGRLFSLLFDLGLIVVITSNRHPENLYQGGLQREQFLFFIEVLSKQARIIELKAQQDYRLRHASNEQNYYYFPLNNNAKHFIHQHYQQLTQNAPIKTTILPVLGRQLTLSAVHNKVLLTSFHELCAEPLASGDYLHLMQQFDTVLLADIPQLSPNQRNEAKRFITLIDVLYEHKIKLICTAQVHPSALYIEGDNTFEFKRTSSRLIEMQSENYRRG